MASNPSDPESNVVDLGKVRESRNIRVVNSSNLSITVPNPKVEIQATSFTGGALTLMHLLSQGVQILCDTVTIRVVPAPPPAPLSPPPPPRVVSSQKKPQATWWSRLVSAFRPKPHSVK